MTHRHGKLLVVLLTLAFFVAFAIKVPIDGKPAAHGNGSTIGFRVASAAQGDDWHAAGVANGGTAIEDPPGVRENGMYLAYLRDPGGNKICALCPPS